jgi:hypothetical protein
MDLTQAQLEIYDYCAKNDFLPVERALAFRAALEAEGNARTFNFATIDFEDVRCPECGVGGFYKRHFLGRLTHRPGCGFSWHISPLRYALVQFGACLRFSLGAGFDLSSDDEKKGKNGCLSGIFGFLFGLFLRLPFAILMIPIQTIVYFVQKKPEGAPGPTTRV